MQYQFDAFVLDTEHLTLFKQQELISTDQRMIRLLVLLMEAYPESCSNQELLQAIWPTTVVSSWSLSRLVSDCRKFFKQYDYSGQVIETVHGHGFRFASELLLTEASTSGASASDKPAHVMPRRLLYPLLSGAAVLLLVMFGLQHSSGLLAGSALTKTELLIGEPANVAGRILWVDDHPENNVEELSFLRARDLAIYTATSTEDALLLLSMYHYDAVISDMGRQGEPLAGLKLLQTLRAEYNEIPVIFYTIMVSEQKEHLLVTQGAQGVAETKEGLYHFVLSLFSADECVDCLR